MATEKSLTDILNASPNGWSENETRTIFEVFDTVHINYTFDACGYRFRDEKGRFVAKNMVKQLVAEYTGALQRDEHQRVRSALRGLKDVVRVHSALRGLKDAMKPGIPRKAPAPVYSSPGDSDIPLQDLVSPPVSMSVIPLEESARISYRADTGEQVYLLRRRISPAPGYTAAEQRFFQEGEDMSYVHDLLSGRTTLPARVPVAAVHASVKPAGERPRFSFGRRFAQAAASVLVAGAALVASYVSHSYAHHQEQAALADRAARETRTQAPMYTPEK